MSTELIPFEVRAELGEKSLLPVPTEEEALNKGRIKYNDWFYNDVYKRFSEFRDEYIKMMCLTEDWAAPLASILKSKESLEQEMSRLHEAISSELTTFQDYARIYGDDWRLWNKEDLYSRSESISHNCIVIMSYLNDFMVIIHNELLSPHYGYKRPTRKTIDATYKVLTKEGVVINLETDPEIRARVEEMIRKNQKAKTDSKGGYRR